MKVLITGANGFLGRHVVAEFLRRGHAVRAMVRPAARLDDLDWADDVEVFRADLRASKNLPEAFDGVDVLVHLAAAVTGGEDAQFAATVVGTEKLLEAMKQTPTRRLVLASSFTVYAWSKVRGTLDETSPVEQGDDLYLRDGYAIAKAWQERVARRLGDENGWDSTVMRPGFIWGRGNEYLAGLGQKIGRHHLVFGPGSQLPLTHVENCADLFATAAEHPAAVGETFNVVDGRDARIGAYLKEHMRRSGEAGLRVPVPYAMGMAMARVAQWASRLAFRGKGKLPSILVPRRFEARFKPLNFPNDKARKLLGWSPPLDAEQCLRRTYDDREDGGRRPAVARHEKAMTP